MTVLMITPDSQMIDRRILLEAKSLVKYGYKVILLAGFECQQEESYIEDGVEIHRYKYDWDDENLKKIRQKLPNNDRLKQFVNKYYMAFARRIFTINPYNRYILTKALEFDFDVLHIHDFPVLKIGSFIAKYKEVPFIYDAHELYYAQDVLPKKTQKKYFKEEKKYILRTDMVITVNKHIAELMNKNYKIKKPKVLFNATKLSPNYVLEPSKLREVANIPSGKKIVLYQGWISAERNIESIVRAVKFFDDDIVLLLIGYGEFEIQLKKTVIENNINEKVKFLGQVESDKMLSYTVGADVGVIPYLPIDLNHKYCSPNKFFEYMRVKVPVITHRLPFFEDMNKIYNTCITCDMQSPEDIAKTINHFFSSNTISNLNLEKASFELSWEEEEKKLFKIYKQLVD